MTLGQVGTIKGGWKTLCLRVHMFFYEIQNNQIAIFNFLKLA